MPVKISVNFNDLPEDIRVLAQDFLNACGVDDRALTRALSVNPAFDVVDIPVTYFPVVPTAEGVSGDERYLAQYLGVSQEQFPPVLLIGDHWIDGRHRVAAARAQGWPTIRAIDLSVLVEGDPDALDMVRRHRIGEISEPTDPDDYSDLGVQLRQATEPIFLTNAEGEHAHGSENVLKALGLPYGVWGLREGGLTTVAPDSAIDWENFYPLTREESQMLGGDGMKTPSGYTILDSYAALYQGKKWAFPHVEYCYCTPFDSESADACTEDAACLRDMLADAATIRPRIEAIGGQVFAKPDDMPNRHVLSILIPLDWLMRNFPGRNEWQMWFLEQVCA